jgi:HAD superfamily hydrolase (TIGR01509 family)
MIERSFEERARVSAPCVRTFLNIARRWDLSERQQSGLLDCNVQQLREWAKIAREHRLLTLETSTLLRISAVLGVFADLRQFLLLVSGAREERLWLLRPRQFPPFDGQRPLEMLCGSFEDQMTVRRHLAAVVEGASARRDIDLSEPASSANEEIWTGVPSRGIQAVCFDAFGTVVEIVDKRRPFHALLRDEPSGTLAVRAITHPISLRELSREMANPVAEDDLVRLEADVEAECASTRLRPGVDEMWSALRRAGLKIAICSNLARPYERALIDRLPDSPDALVLSFRAGLMKPQQQIYRLVCRELRLQPSEVLFTGDDLEADVFGPCTIDALAMPIEEFESSYSRRVSFFAPSEVTELFARIAATTAR